MASKREKKSQDVSWQNFSFPLPFKSAIGSTLVIRLYLHIKSDWKIEATRFCIKSSILLHSSRWLHANSTSAPSTFMISSINHKPVPPRSDQKFSCNESSLKFPNWQPCNRRFETKVHMGTTAQVCHDHTLQEDLRTSNLIFALHQISLSIPSQWESAACHCRPSFHLCMNSFWIIYGTEPTLRKN